jgi:hypothetical protein
MLNLSDVASEFRTVEMSAIINLQKNISYIICRNAYDPSLHTVSYLSYNGSLNMAVKLKPT